MSSLALPSTSATAASATNSTAGTLSAVGASNSASQDRFLKLLVAQLTNQDPMNPMDNAAMTTQMAQINTVNGIDQLNTTMTRMLSQLSSLQALQGISLTGHHVLVPGTSLNLQNGQYTGSFSLPASADSVTVDVLSPGGQLLKHLSLGPQTSGTHPFQWADSSGVAGTANPVFQVSASALGKPLVATPLEQATVQSVSLVNGALQLTLQDGSTVAYSRVVSVL